MQAVGEFDDNHPHVAGHRQNQFAETLGLVFGLAVVFEFVEFGKAVHHLGNGIAEGFGNLRLADRRVFQHIVHQAGAQGLQIHAPAGQLGGYADGVGDIGFAALPLLRTVGAKGESAGFFQHLQVFRAQVVGFAKQHLAHGRGDGIIIGKGRRNAHKAPSAAAFENFFAHLAGSDFAQRGNGGFVVADVVNQRVGAVFQLAGAAGGDQG